MGEPTNVWVVFGLTSISAKVNTPIAVILQQKYSAKIEQYQCCTTVHEARIILQKLSKDILMYTSMTCVRCEPLCNIGIVLFLQNTSAVPQQFVLFTFCWYRGQTKHNSHICWFPHFLLIVLFLLVVLLQLCMLPIHKVDLLSSLYGKSQFSVWKKPNAHHQIACVVIHVTGPVTINNWKNQTFLLTMTCRPFLGPIGKRDWRQWQIYTIWDTHTLAM